MISTIELSNGELGAFPALQMFIFNAPVTDSIRKTNGQTEKVSWNVTPDVQEALENGDPKVQWLFKKAKEHRWGNAVTHSKEEAVIQIS